MAERPRIPAGRADLDWIEARLGRRLRRGLHPGLRRGLGEVLAGTVRHDRQT